MHLTRLELAQPYGHYHLKVACIPISPQVHENIITYNMRFVQKIVNNLRCAVAGLFVDCPGMDVGEAV